MKKITLLLLLVFSELTLNSQTILNENFAGFVTPSGWTRQNTATGSDTWVIYGGGLGAGIFHSSTIQQDEWLITPSLNLNNYSSMFLQFFINIFNENTLITLDAADFFIKVSKDGGINWENIWNETENNIWNKVFNRYTINVSEFIGNSNVKFAFQYKNKIPNNSPRTVIQLYEVSVASCPVPIISSLNPLTWQDIPDFSGSFDIEYGPRGFVQGQGTLIQGITGNTYNFPEQSCKSYDFFIRANCGNSLSNWTTRRTYSPVENNIGVSDIKNTSVNLSWNSNSSEFSLEYGPAGFTTGTGTEITGITSKNFLLENLSSCTAYTIRIKPSCTLEAYSIQTNFTTLTSLTSPLTPPFSETFENIKSLCEIGYLTNFTSNNITENSLRIVNGINGSTSNITTRDIQLTANKNINFQIQTRKFSQNIITNGVIKIIRNSDSNIVAEFFLNNLTTDFANYNFNFNPTVTGNYKFILGFNPNSEISNNSVIYFDNFMVSDVLSTENFQNNELIFYPNPTSSAIIFNKEITNLDIFDVTGKKVKSFQKTETSYNIEGLKNGLYLIKVITLDGKSFHQKLIKN